MLLVQGMHMWEHRGTFLLSRVGDLQNKFLPGSRESCAKADFPRLCKHDSCLSQVGACPRDPTELILLVSVFILRVPEPAFIFLYSSRWPVNPRNLISQWLLREARASHPRCPNTCLVSHVILLSLLDDDCISPLCAGYRLFPGTFLWKGSQKLPTALKHHVELILKTFVVSFSPGVPTPFVVGTVWSCQPFNVGKP